MQIGIMSRTFQRPTLEEELDAVVDHGMDCMQFDLSSAGVASLADGVDEAVCDRIRKETSARGITIAAVNGMFNMIHPDIEQRRVGLQNLGVLAAACDKLGASVIALCTGTRNPKMMWLPHPENGSPEAWEDLTDSMEQALRMAEEHGVTLAFEPEVANVVDTAQAARRLLDEMGSRHLKVAMDGANIFHSGELARMDEILDEAFALLGEDIIIAHAKDLDHDGAAGNLAAGKGVLNYDRYLSLLGGLVSDVPVILHGLREEEVDGCVAFLRGLA